MADGLYSTAQKRNPVRMRIGSLILVCCLLLLPGLLILLGTSALGDRVAFALSAIGWTIISELFGYRGRQNAAAVLEGRAKVIPGPARFGIEHVGIVLGVLVAVVLNVLSLPETSGVIRGIGYGLLVAVGNDLMRMFVALCLAATGGKPFYFAPVGPKSEPDQAASRPGSLV